MTLPMTTSSAHEAYTDFAPFYDEFVADARYGGWVRRVVELATFGASPHELTALDVGCGTGLSTLGLMETGLRLTACEPVAAMAARASIRLPGDVDVHVASAEMLPKLGTFDLVVMLNDVVNYLVARENFSRALERAADNLRRGGAIAFDVNTLHAFRVVFGQATERHAGGRRFVWRGLTDGSFAPGDTAEAHLEVTDVGQELTSVHIQRHHPPAVVMRALRAAGLTPRLAVGQDADGRFVPGRPNELRDHKIVYVATKS